MHDLFMKIFGDIPSDTEIGLFSIGHFSLMAFAVILPIVLCLIFRKKSDKAKLIVSIVLSILIPMMYALDFIVQPFYSSSGTLLIDKLPFHVCTLMGVLIPFVYFNKKFKWAREIVVVWALISATIYIIYPGLYLNRPIKIYSYCILQSFGYHALLIAWAIWMFVTRQVEFKIHNFWKSVVAMCVIMIWAEFANQIYVDQNFFFLHSEPSWFGLGFLPQWALFPVMFTAMSLLILVVYSIFSGINKGLDKKGRHTMAIKQFNENVKLKKA